jgi:uncharacterized membrane protein YhdT
MQQKLSAFFNRYPLYVLLVPFFFVLHGYNENVGFIGGGDILLLVGVYSAGALLVFGLCFLVYRNRVKAAMMTFCIMSFYLFFGAFRDFLKMQWPVAARYRYLLSFSFIALLTVFIYIKKTKRSLLGFPLFFNTLLCIYLLVDMAGVMAKWIHPPANKFSVYSGLHKNNYQVPAGTPRPDIYFLLFDEYASSLALREQYGFYNELDSFLLDRGFHIQPAAYSNYNYTPASVASMLNADFITGIRNNTMLSVQEISDCHTLVKSSEVIKFLTNQGYNIVNHSIFDLPGNPSPVNQVLLPLKTRLISDNTFFSRLYRDMGWMQMYINWPGQNFFKVPENNLRLLEMTKTFSKTDNKAPDFLYAHFYMPHDPFYLDRDGRRKDKTLIMAEERERYRPSRAYLNYLQYTNSEIKALINTIQQNTKGSAAIILMGDHGFREKIDSNLHQNYQCMNAVYLPNKDYHLFYDSITCVNQFRVLFNTMFKQNFPLLKDSTIFLTGKE